MTDPMSQWQHEPTQAPTQSGPNPLSQWQDEPTQAPTQSGPTDLCRNGRTDEGPERTQDKDATVRRLQGDLQELRDRCTVLLQENFGVKQQLADKTNEVKILVVQNALQQRTIDELKTAMCATRRSDVDRSEVGGAYSLNPCKRRKHKPNSIGAGVTDVKVVNFLKSIQKDTDELATLASMELSSVHPPIRQWLHRGHLSATSTSHEPPTRMLLCAYEPYPINAANTYYHPTASEGTVAILRDRALVRIAEEPWRSITPPEGGMDVYVDAVMKDDVLQNIFHKLISQRQSYRRQKMRQMFFSALGYKTILLSNDKSTQACCTAVTDGTVGREQPVETNEQIRNAEVRDLCHKFFPAGLDSFPDMSTWRIQAENFLRFGGDGARRTGSAADIYADNTITDKLYVTALSRTCLHEFLGYNPEQDLRNPTDMSVLTLARVDVWVMSSIWILAQGLQKQGRLTQKIYQRAYDRFIGPATTQLMGSLYSYVRLVAPESVIAIPVQASWLRSSDTQGSETQVTDIVDSPEGHSFLRVNHSWIRKVLSSTVGYIQDAFLSKAERTDHVFTLYEFVRNPQVTNIPSTHPTDVDTVS